MTDQSKIIRSEQFTWPGIKRKEYKTEGSGFKGIVRYVILGEQEDEQALNMQTRYFEIEQGGYSSLERHQHPHTVVIAKGAGSLILGNEYRNLNFMDTVYIAPGLVHQFHADRGSSFGFLCVVDRDRDRPEIPENEEALKQWITDPDVRKRARI